MTREVAWTLWLRNEVKWVNKIVHYLGLGVHKETIAVAIDRGLQLFGPAPGSPVRSLGEAA